MKPRIDPASNSSQQKLFDASAPLLLEFIDTKHELVKLADSIEWEIFEEHWRKQFSDVGGQMANSGRRVAGLLMIQHMENLSDEGLVAQWVLNPYYQYFCGEVHFQHKRPIAPMVTRSIDMPIMTIPFHIVRIFYHAIITQVHRRRMGCLD